MCEYCDKKLVDDGDQKNITDERVSAGILGEINLFVDVYCDSNEHWMLSAGWLSDGDRGFFHDSPINYCPMCGRKLEVEK